MNNYVIKNSKNYNIFVQCQGLSINDTITDGEKRGYFYPGPNNVMITFQDPTGINALNIKALGNKTYLTFQGLQSQMDAFLNTLTEHSGLGPAYPFGSNEASYEITGTTLFIAN